MRGKREKESAKSVRGFIRRAVRVRAAGVRALNRGVRSVRAAHPGAPRLAAFTLIELMVVIVILGILAAFVVPRIAKRPEDARVTRARVEIATISQQLEMYNLDNGSYPTTEEGLKALVERPEGEYTDWKGPYLQKKKIPVDPWGNPYMYVSPGVNNEDFDLYSMGKDGEEGGEGYDADITNWE